MTESNENTERNSRKVRIGYVEKEGDEVLRIESVDLVRSLFPAQQNLISSVAAGCISIVRAVILGDASKIYEGMLVRRLGQLLSVPVADALVGRVVNALGEPVDGGAAIPASVERWPIHRPAPNVEDLTPTRFLETDWSRGGGVALAAGSDFSHVAMLARSPDTISPPTLIVESAAPPAGVGRPRLPRPPARRGTPRA